MNIGSTISGLGFSKVDLYVDVGLIVATSLIWLAIRSNKMPTLSGLIQAWSDFTDTLNTRGGTIGLLFVSSFVLGVMVMRAHYLNIDSEAASTIRTTFSGFTGALLIALTSKDKNGDTPPKTNVVEQKSVVTTTSAPVEKVADATPLPKQEGSNPTG